MKLFDALGPYWFFINLALLMMSMFVDPFFFFVIVIDDDRKCLDLVTSLRLTLVVIRSLLDAFHILYEIYFKTQNVVQVQNYFIDHNKIWSKKYLLDILASLPLPQVVLFVAFRSDFGMGMRLLKYLVIAQLLPRYIRMYLLFSEARNSSVLLQLPNGLDNAAFYFLVYLLIALIVGSLWYFLAIERLSECWKQACLHAGCKHVSFHCNANIGDQLKFKIEALCSLETSNPTIVDYGIFKDALQSGIVKVKSLVPKFMYSFRWGIRSLCFAQEHQTSNNVWENIFSIVVTVSGVVLIPFLLWNFMTFCQDNRVSERKIKLHMQEIEQLKLFHNLSNDLKQQFSIYYRSVYHGTEGFNINNFINDLPSDLSGAMKLELCLPLRNEVEVFARMDDQILTELLAHFKFEQYIEGRVLVQEGNQVKKLLVIIGGETQSSTTSVVKTVYGAELVQSVVGLMPHCSSHETVTAVTKVEAFYIEADDLEQFFDRYPQSNGQLPSNFWYQRNLAATVRRAAWSKWWTNEHQRHLLAPGQWYQSGTSVID